MRVRPPTAVARLAETPRGESACLGGHPPCHGYHCRDWWIWCACCLTCPPLTLWNNNSCGNCVRLVTKCERSWLTFPGMCCKHKVYLTPKSVVLSRHMDQAIIQWILDFEIALVFVHVWIPQLLSSESDSLYGRVRLGILLCQQLLSFSH